MTEETFEKAWDIMSDRGRYKDQLQMVNKILTDGIAYIDIREIYRLSPNLKTDIVNDVEKRLREFASTLETCIDICNEKLKEL